MFNVIVDYLPEDEEVAVVQQTTSRRTEPIEPLVRRPGRAPVSRGRAQGADRRGPGPLRGEAIGGEPSRAAGAGVRQPVGELGSRAAGRAIAGARGQGAGALAGAISRRARRHPRLAHPTLRHRILLGYRAEADGVSVDTVIDRLLEHVKGPHH